VWRASDRGGGHHARVVSQCAAPGRRGRCLVVAAKDALAKDALAKDALAQGV
jgi:hypothetical protein